VNSLPGDSVDQTGDFLAATWGDGPHSVCWLDPERAFTFAIVADAAAVLRQLPRLQGVDVWISAHPLKGIPIRGRGDRNDVAEVIAIPADLDWAHPTRRTDQPLPTEAEVRTRLAQLGPELQPSIVVHSGHGLQPWWVLTNPVSAEEGERLADGITAKLAEVGLDNGRQDLASILRLPGTHNHKGGTPIPVVIESFDANRRFTPEYLRKRLPAPATEGAVQRGGTRHRNGRVTHEQQALTNLVLTTYKGHDVDVWRDGSIHVVRPGKPAREGSSASIIVGEDGDAILTVFSDRWPDLPPGSYVLGTDGALHHPSDPLARFRINVTEAGSLTVNYQDSLPIPINWPAFAKRDLNPRSWLVEHFWPRGRGMALYAAAKEGKSELTLWCAGCLAMGVHPWSGQTIPPVSVAYFDFEMTEDDLEERLSDFAFDYDRLDRLHYFLLPALHPMNVEQGGIEVATLVERYRAEAVVIDTFGRAVVGIENDADTVQSFYRHTSIRLKQAGVGYLRLDHTGKDATKGQRGSSAKRDDVDVVWQQKRTNTGVLLNCSGLSRLGWVGPTLAVERHVDPTGVVSYSAAVRMGWGPGVSEKARELDDLGAPLDVTKQAAIQLLKTNGVKPGRIQVLLEAMRYRREAGTGPGTTPKTDQFPTASEPSYEGPSDLFSDQPE
jgi:hypothetical protein